jgi:hypothetical protein
VLSKSRIQTQQTPESQIALGIAASLPQKCVFIKNGYSEAGDERKKKGLEQVREVI